jgi:hypothetical protein
MNLLSSCGLVNYFGKVGSEAVTAAAAADWQQVQQQQ